MRYRFKLEALRQYRQFQEDTLQKELSQAMRFRDQLIDVLNNQLKMRSQTEKDLATLQGKTPTGAQMRVYESYLRRISEQIVQQRNQVDQAEKICTDRRKTLLGAVQKRKALDKLREQDYEAYLSDLNFQEQKFINEMAINRFALNKDRAVICKPR
jgi:flagellar protein FliJ